MAPVFARILHRLPRKMFASRSSPESHSKKEKDRQGAQERRDDTANAHLRLEEAVLDHRRPARGKAGALNQARIADAGQL